MCFSSQISLTTFILGVLSAILLLVFGNPIFKKENITLSIFSFFIVVMQLFDYLFWIDLNNLYGINKISTLFASIINPSQPIILYIIKLIVYTPRQFNIYDFILLLLNCIYTINVIVGYISFVKKGDLITRSKNNHLKWKWLSFFNGPFYLILFALNIFYLSRFTYSLVCFIIIYLFFILSYILFNYHVGELWCFFGSSIPLLMLFFSYVIR